MTPVPQLKGSTTTLTGIFTIVLGAVGLFAHIWNGAHGGTLDPTTVTGTVGLIGTGVGLIKSADQNQGEKK